MASQQFIKIEAAPSFRDLQGRWARAEDAQLDQRRDEVRFLGRKLRGYMQEEAPKKTGDFARSHRFRTFVANGRTGFTMTAQYPLKNFIVKGTRAHEIKARRANFLRFEVGGKVVFAKRVWHTGTKPNPYDQRALNRWEVDADLALNRIAQRWVKEVT